MAYQEDSPPMEPPPRGILSGGSGAPIPVIQGAEDMAPGSDEDNYSDAETTHAGVMMEAIKSGDVDAFRDATAAFVRECVRNYNKGKSLG